jgi:hypothetical protein
VVEFAQNVIELYVCIMLRLKVEYGNCSECKPMCFIVTAVGTPPEKLELFYSFRDDFLEITSIGRHFIHLYYRISPFFANAIGRRQNLKVFSYWLIVKPIGYLIEKINSE